MAMWLDPKRKRSEHSSDPPRASASELFTEFTWQVVIMSELGRTLLAKTPLEFIRVSSNESRNSY